MSGNDATLQVQPIDSPQQTKQSLLLDAFRRIEEHSPVWMLPRLISTQHLHKTLQEARQRVRDSHAAQMNLVGVDVANSSDGGGISVQGDTTVFNLGDASKAGSGLLKKAIPLALAAIAGGSALGLAPMACQWLASKYGNSTPAATQQQSSSNPPSIYSTVPAYQLDLEVKDTP